MIRVVFVLHAHRAEVETLAARARSWLESNGHQAVAFPDDGEPAAVGTADTADLAVSLGGDGTMLRTVAWAAPRGVPVLGINLGRLGYLTEVEPARMEWALERFVSGNFSLEPRMMLQVSATGCTGIDGTAEEHGGPHQSGGFPGDGFRFGGFHNGRYQGIALNEAVLEKTIPGHTVRLAASIGGQPFVTYAADGLLVATPTGSTAYNLSARGPILSPRLRAMVVTPLAPHMLFDRPMVLGADEQFTMTVAGPLPALLVVDGTSIATLDPGATVLCQAAPVDAQFVVLGRRDFHAIVRSRFALTDR